MVAYSFQKRFVAPILGDIKRQTIRGARKRHARAGETVQLYTGMRTKFCHLVGTATCLSVSPIAIDFNSRQIVYPFAAGTTTIYPGGLDQFARDDGFDNWPQMQAFWQKYHPSPPVFRGWLIRWFDFEPLDQP